MLGAANADSGSHTISLRDDRLPNAYGLGRGPLHHLRLLSKKCLALAGQAREMVRGFNSALELTLHVAIDGEFIGPTHAICPSLAFACSNSAFLRSQRVAVSSFMRFKLPFTPEEASDYRGFTKLQRWILRGVCEFPTRKHPPVL